MLEAMDCALYSLQLNFILRQVRATAENQLARLNSNSKRYYLQL